MAVNSADFAPSGALVPPKTTALSQSIVWGLAAIADALIIVAVGFAVFLSYVGLDSGKLSIYAAGVTIFALLVVQAFYVTGIYRFNSIINPAGQVGKLAAIFLTVFLVIVSFAFALKISEQYSRIWAFSWVSISLPLLVGSRFAIAAQVKRWARSGQLARNIVVYGASDQGERLIRHIEGMDEPWNRIIGVFDDRRTRVSDEVCGYPVLGNLDDLVDYCRTHRSDEILVALPWNSQQRILEVVRLMSSLPANIRLSPEFVGYDLFHRRTTNQFGIPMLSVLEKPMSGWGVLSKVVLDFGLGAVMTLAALPVMALCAIAIRIESQGPVLFKQKRYGFNNQLIEIYKFRSMYTDRLDHDAEKLTERDDPRVTRVGRFLRRSSLDELPQLFNVMKGDMSIVGPRPHAVRAKAGGKLYEDVVSEYAVRHKVKPGITGWAQVNGWRGNTQTEDAILKRVEHDLYYIENWSLALDLYIILLTARSVISGENSY